MKKSAYIFSALWVAICAGCAGYQYAPATKAIVAQTQQSLDAMADSYVKACYARHFAEAFRLFPKVKDAYIEEGGGAEGREMGRLVELAADEGRDSDLIGVLRDPAVPLDLKYSLAGALHGEVANETLPNAPCADVFGSFADACNSRNFKEAFRLFPLVMDTYERDGDVEGGELELGRLGALAADESTNANLIDILRDKNISLDLKYELVNSIHGTHRHRWRFEHSSLK